jgi:hypothetical protein
MGKMNIFENEDYMPKVKLQKKSTVPYLKPFFVNSQTNSALQPIIDSFNNSDSVNVGYTTIKKDGEEESPSLKKKTIWLTGSSLRNHLSNETFYNYTCVTNASPDEIKMILNQSSYDFQQVKPKGEIGNVEKYKNLPDETNDKYFFYISKIDEQNNEMEVTASVSGNLVYISTLNSNIKFKIGNDKLRKFTSSISEDAKGRDFSVNAIYLKLKDSNGNNNDISDPVGGMHDIANNNIKLLNSTSFTFKTNPALIITFCELSSKFNKDKKIEKSDLVSIKKNIDNFKDYPKLFIRTLRNSVNSSSTPIFSFLNNLYITGMFGKMFSGLKISLPHMGLPRYFDFVIGYLLHENEKEKVSMVLSELDFNKFDIKEVEFTMDLTKWIKTEDDSILQSLLDHQNNQSINKIYNYLKSFGKDVIFKNAAKKYLEM